MRPTRKQPSFPSYQPSCVPTPAQSLSSGAVCAFSLSTTIFSEDCADFLSSRKMPASGVHMVRIRLVSLRNTHLEAAPKRTARRLLAEGAASAALPGVEARPEPPLKEIWRTDADRVVMDGKVPFKRIQTSQGAAAQQQ